MTQKKIISLLCLSVFCAAAFMLGSLTIASASKSNVGVLKARNSSGVTLTLGKAEMVDVSGDVADVLVADPDIVDVMAVKSNRLYLVGSSLGDTNIMALDAQGNVLKKINVHVKMDTDRLDDMILSLYPNENVQTRALIDQLVLTGEVSTPVVANKITNLVGHYVSEVQGTSGVPVDTLIVNMLNVRGEQQVMLRVKIVEASRSALKDLGLEGNSTGQGGIGDLAATFATAAALGLSNPTQLGVAALTYNSGDFGNLNFITRALEEEGIVNTLAEPNLTAISGEQAGFLAGGEFPIPTEIDRNGNLIYEFRPFGVSLNFRPIVMSESRISLQLTTEVSTTSFDQNLQLNGINVPTFNVRRAETTVELPSGGTLMIAGLLESDSISSLTQLPGVKDVPVVGDLIKSDTFQRDESEVVVMITPYLVRPFANDVTKPASVSPPPVSEDGQSMNYGALTQDLDSSGASPFLPPIPERQESQIGIIFAKNVRRLYGEKAPEDLLGENSLGYVLD
ncbi:MAG: type II and III secretion system protein family protein [Alphaproteobacteria bacterium]|nr:type II and III secretion system protein family protein [Alphaproteobacteria bacterium]